MREHDRLPEATALDLLRHAQVGRIALSTPEGPHILPASFVMRRHRGHDTLVVRTTQHSLLSAQPHHTTVTVEIDNLGSSTADGTDANQLWTVTARGRSELVTDATEILELDDIWPLSLTEDSSASLIETHLYKRIILNEVTGRRFDLIATS